MQYLTKHGIDPPYNRKHDDTDRCYQLIVFKNIKLTSRLPLHHSLITQPSRASFTRLYNSDLNVVLHNTYIFPRREYNHITAYTRTSSINYLTPPLLKYTTVHTHIRVLIQSSYNLYFQTYSSHKTIRHICLPKRECDLATAYNQNILYPHTVKHQCTSHRLKSNCTTTNRTFAHIKQYIAYIPIEI